MIYLSQIRVLTFVSDHKINISFWPIIPLFPCEMSGVVTFISRFYMHIKILLMKIHLHVALLQNSCILIRLKIHRYRISWSNKIMTQNIARNKKKGKKQDMLWDSIVISVTIYLGFYLFICHRWINFTYCIFCFLFIFTTQYFDSHNLIFYFPWSIFLSNIF